MTFERQFHSPVYLIYCTYSYKMKTVVNKNYGYVNLFLYFYTHTCKKCRAEIYNEKINKIKTSMYFLYEFQVNIDLVKIYFSLFEIIFVFITNFNLLNFCPKKTFTYI